MSLSMAKKGRSKHRVKEVRRKRSQWSTLS